MYSNNSMIDATKYNVAVNKIKGSRPDIYSVLCFCLVVACCVLGNAKYTVLSLAIIICFSLYVFKPQYLIGPIFFMTIFDDYLVAFSGQSFSRFCVIIFIFGVLLSVITHHLKFKYIRESVIVALMLIMGILLSIFPTFQYTSFPISYVVNLVLLFCMMNCVPNNSKFIVGQLYKYAWLGIIFVAVLIFQNGVDVFAGTRLTIDSGVNSNQLAMGFAQMVAVFAAYSTYQNKKIINYFAIVILLIGLFLTGSRSGLIAALFSVVCVYLISLWRTKGSKQIIKGIFIIILIAAVIYTLYMFLFTKIPLLMNRFTYENIISTGGSNRLDVWKAILFMALPGHRVFGIGFDPSNVYYSVQSINGIGHGSHNLIVEILAKSGIIGMVIYLYFLIRLFRRIKKNINNCYDIIIPTAMIIAILVNGIGEDVLTARFLWFGVGLVFLLLNSNNKNIDTNFPNDSELKT